MTPSGSAFQRSGIASLSGLARLVQSRYGLLLLGLGLLLVLGVATLTNYGASMDEGQNSYMGRTFLKVYETGNLLRSPRIDYFNGPFYFMVFTLTSRLFHALNPRWLLTDGLHLTNYLAFLVGVFFFYRIALRLLPRGLALFATALFTTQPVFYGHAFINQKDTPLMVFFLASLELGWTAVDRRLALEEGRPNESDTPVRQEGAVGEWKRLPKGTRVATCAGVLLGLVVLLDLWWVGSVRGAAEKLLPQLYQGDGPALLVGLFGRIAEDAYKTPLRAYLAKLASFFVWGRLVISVGMIAGVLGLWRLLLPQSFSNQAGRWIRQWGPVVVAGIVLGMATSIRVLAPFAGLLVGAYWIGRSGKRALPGLVVYGAVAMATTYLTWPVLWGNPLVALTHRATGLTEFADHSVHLWGVRYFSGALPWEYLPTLLLIQLTLPAVVLFLVGTPYSWILSPRGRRLVVGLVWVWLCFRLPRHVGLDADLQQLPPCAVCAATSVSDHGDWASKVVRRVSCACASGRTDRGGVGPRYRRDCQAASL
jgi:hypothetical protein